MLKLGIGLVWLTVAAGLYFVEPGLPPGYGASFAANGKWIALFLAVMNLLRPSLMLDIAVWVLRRIGLVAPLPKPPDNSPPPRPVVRPDLDFTDDRIQVPPPAGGIES